MMAASLTPAVVGSPAANDWNNAGIAPEEYVTPLNPPGPGSQLNACISMLCETPAAINNDMPEPNPYLLTTSSINNMSTPPKNS